MKQENCTFCEGTGQIVSCTTISGFKTCDCIIIPQEEPKQETLEEVAKEYASRYGEIDIVINKAVKFGAEWQQERMYSEEEAGELVYNIIGKYAKQYGIMIDGAKLNALFEQFKKKY
jgi:prophage tail gpP-like protein